jgi:uncharacterized oligopeptide transporter (OPT) family protein
MRTPRLLPAIDSPGYHVLLATVAIFVLGPLGAIASAYMNFSLGFFVGGQVLAGILGSAVTYAYGPEGKHGANYMQTMAASVASVSAMAVLIQAMVWLGMPIPATWKLVAFLTCIGMFGVGVGMLYTPILVDRLRLEYPSGHAVANILRALTDKRLLKRSIAQLGSGTGLGVAFAWAAERVAWASSHGLSASTIGAGMVVGSRIAVPGLLMGLIGAALEAPLVRIGWLEPGAPFRKIGFLVALAMILGAAIVDLSLIAVDAIARLRRLRSAREERTGDTQDAWKEVRTGRLIAWVGLWGAALVIVATQLLGQPVGYVVFALGLTVVFVCINGISLGISDSNPISSAFVIAVLLMSGLGLRDPIVGLMSASILLVACSTGCDMQQDRSTGARLGTSRVIQFRYQVLGIVVGAVLCVGLAKTFLRAYPVLAIDTYANPSAKVDQWQSAMTFKFVGALRDLGHLPGYKVQALLIGLAIGFGTEVARKLLSRSRRYVIYTRGDGERPPTRRGFVVGWFVDALLLPSPYASSFGGFVELWTTVWFAAGGALSSAANAAREGSSRPDAVASRARTAGKPEDDPVLPEDMSTTSLVGGGLIAGESLFALAVGVFGLLRLVG